MVKKREEVLRVGRQLSEYITGISFNDLPGKVMHQAKMLLLDSIGTIYMGSRKEEAGGISKFLRNLGANPECTVVGADFKTKCQWAAFANASYAQVHDNNDGHLMSGFFGGVFHPARIVIPTALAVGEKLSVSGEELITAIVVGYDVGTRIRGIKGLGGIESRPPAATYTSAAVSSRLMGLSKDKVLHAMGIAGYLSPKKFTEKFIHGYDTNFLDIGYKAKVGIEAAMLADEGLSGPPLVDDTRLSTRFAERGLWREFELMNVYIKPYPTCRMTHGAIDAILDIKKHTGFKPPEVDEVTIYQPISWILFMEKLDVNSYYKSCQFNLPYIAACAMIDGEVGERQFTKERIADPKVHKLAKKIKVIHDEDLDALCPEKGLPTVIKIKIKNGKTHEKRIDFPKGDPKNPLTDEEISQKFLKWAGPSITKERALELKRAILELDRLENVSIFTNLLSD